MTLFVYYAAVDDRMVKQGPGESVPTCRVALFTHVTSDPTGFKRQVEKEHARMRRSFTQVPENVQWVTEVNNYVDFQI